MKLSINKQAQKDRLNKAYLLMLDQAKKHAENGYKSFNLYFPKCAEGLHWQILNKLEHHGVECCHRGLHSDYFKAYIKE